MRKYFIIAYVIVGLLVSAMIAVQFNIKGMGKFNLLKIALRKGTALELDDNAGWFNTDNPIQINDLHGKIVLLDFWTSCCINCLHTLKDIKKLESKYQDELVVIGVHTAKFTNEGTPDSLKQAILRYGIKHPVVNDRTFTIWHKYNVRAWPTFILIDSKGIVIGYYSGEGNYEAIDAKINQTIDTFKDKGLLNYEPVHFKSGSDNTVSNTASNALLFPGKVLADETSGRLFIADSNHNRIVITDMDGNLIDIAGDGYIGKNDGKFSESNFYHPQGMALDGDFLYVADMENHLIRKLDLKEKRVTTIAGTGKQAEFMAKGGAGINAALNSPWDLCLVENRLFIAMAGSHQIWVMNLTTNLVQLYAGNGRQARLDGHLLDGSLAQPSGLTTDGKKLYFTDSAVSSIRSADLNGEGLVESIIGLDLFQFGDNDGIGNLAKLQNPLGILYHNSVIYITDTYNNKIKVLNLKDTSCKTFLGTGKAGSSDGKNPEFFEPGGITAANGKLYIADTNNHSIRVVDLVFREVSTLQITGF